MSKTDIHIFYYWCPIKNSSNCPQAGQAFTFCLSSFVFYLFRRFPLRSNWLQPQKVNKDLTRPSGTLSEGRGKTENSFCAAVDKKLKIVCVSLKASKLLSASWRIIKQGRFFTASLLQFYSWRVYFFNCTHEFTSFNFFTLFL